MRRIASSMVKQIKLAIVICFLVTVVLSGYFLFTSPVAFQKSAAITFVEKATLILAKPENWIDIREIIQSIPYQNDDEMIYEVDPKQKYIKTIKEGYGNCSHLAFGLGYYLDKQKHEYQIVHFLQPDNFLHGGGHTVVNTPYAINGKQHYGIVDVLEGGLPTNNNALIDIASLRKGGFSNPSLLPLNKNKDDVSPLYGEFLNKSVIGVINHNEINSYFNFMETVYVPLGNKRVEKILYDGLAFVFGIYPNIYVYKSDYEALYNDHKLTRYLAIALLVSTRMLLVFLGFLIAGYVFLMGKNRIAHI